MGYLGRNTEHSLTTKIPAPIGVNKIHLKKLNYFWLKDNMKG